MRLLFVEDEGRIYVLSSSTETAWFSRVAREGRAHLRWEDGQETTAAAEVLSAPAIVAKVHALGRARYGPAVWESYFAGVRRVLALAPGALPPRANGAERLRREFNTAAAGYDAAVLRHPIERYLKDRVARRIEETLSGADRVLEIGPGTGFHTLRLLGAGHRVLAVDISEEMLGRLEEGARALGREDRLETRRLRLGESGTGLADLPDGQFGGICSAFGAFDLEREIRRAVPTLARLAAPNAPLVFTALNRPGIVPMVWELALGRIGPAFRRTAEVVPPGGTRYPLELYLRTPAAWDALFAPAFRRTGLEPVSVVAPPFHSDPLLRFLGPAGAERARRLDERLSSHPRLWVAAEWVLLVYARTAPGPVAARSASPVAGPAARSTA